MTDTLKPRQPKGIPVGGEFAAYRYKEPGFALKFAKDRQSMAERRELLRSAGYIPATTLQATDLPSTTEHREEWWDRNVVAAEYRASGKTYPQMPDDNTPAMTPGQSMGGNRRTHRMNYKNGDVSLRMPSATAIKRYSGANGNPTFDVPVSVAIQGGAPVQGWVRVTKTGPDSWEATAQGGSGPSADILSESVAAVLESRRPSVALSRVPDLLAAHKAREEAKGDPMIPVKSSFIDAIGYDESTGTMATKIGEKMYGHRVSKDFFEQVKNSERPGTIFNKFIKGNPGAGVQKCPKCARFFTPARAHACPTNHKPESGLNQDYTEMARKRAETVAARRSNGVDPAAGLNLQPAPAPVNTAPGIGAQPVPLKKTGLPGRRATVAPERLVFQHLENPIRNRGTYSQELTALKTSARAYGFDVVGNGVDARAEATCGTENYLAVIAVGTDGVRQRFIDGKPVAAFEPGHVKARAMEDWAYSNGEAMARVTEAEEYLRDRRAAVAAAAAAI
ncbi:MAG TPA: hypothetical protein VF867_18705 [Arthrobacter sp.]